MHLGWVLLAYGVLRLLGRVQAEQRGRYVGGGLALTVGGLLLIDSLSQSFWRLLVRRLLGHKEHQRIVKPFGASFRLTLLPGTTPDAKAGSC